jgi:DNA-binding MarR family transcriptional regulator
MTGLPLIAQARADLELVGWRLNVLLTLAHELLDVHEYRRVKTEALARLAGCSQATATKALAALVARGYLQRRDDYDGPEYRLFWTRAYSSVNQPDAPSSPRPAA